MIACLLPVRNGAEELPGYLESMAHLADAVVALDDGSTDATADLLEASPLVRKVIRNPPRESYAGWDDGANRRLLLAAAGELRPDWIAFVDADERLDAEDAVALRDFLGGDAIPACAYGLQLHRVWDGRAEPSFTWVYRVFAWAPGQELSPDRLHFNPVPTSIPRAAWVRTTIRLRHLESPERLDARRRKYREADPRSEWQRNPARGLEGAPSELVEWQRRQPGMPVLDPGSVTLAASSRTPPPPAEGPTLLCLLPVRNGAGELPGYLESVQRFADGVVALDDGSTDATAELLEASPLVREVIRNPARQSYAGWDDAANRRRLLDAARELGARWVLFLDADERIDPDDGDALRDFVERQAEPGFAYGFRVYRMIGDAQHYDRAGLWVYRLFSPDSGHELPPDRLHLVPIATSIPRERWRKTTIRIQHLASITPERRLERVRKYEQADPERRWQRDYEALLADGSELKPWHRRPPGIPALVDPLERGAREELDLEALDLEGPVLSAIIISRDDEDTIERSVRSVVEQECPAPFEVIVVVSGTDRTAEIVRERFPHVKLIELPHPALPGGARNAGLAVARGDYVSFPGSHVELPPGSLAARLRAHELGHPMVTGSVLNGTPTQSGWASYFLDHSGALPGRPSGRLAGAPARCSYAREALLGVGGFPEDVRAGEDTVVNQELWRRGYRAYRAPEVVLTHHTRCTDPLKLLRHQFRRGRAYGRILVDQRRGRRPLLRPGPLALLASYPRRRISRTDFLVALWAPELVDRYRQARPLVVAGVLAAWAGTWLEALRPRRGKLRPLLLGGGAVGDRPAPPVEQPSDQTPESDDARVPIGAT